jgi:class 3 adenylate cyclase/YHS domain-containing protein
MLARMVAEQHTFLFADLAGFTALTEAHGDRQAADVAAEFSASVRPLLSPHAAEEVKTIGDALMIRGRDPAAAIRLGLGIVDDVGRQHGFPAVRVGMSTGQAIERDGDWFGATVNIAARVSGLASGGEVLLTEATKAAAGDPGSVRLHERGRRTLKNIGEPVLLFAAVRQGEPDSAGLPIDPVCRMAVDREHGAGRLSYEGVEFYFCSLDCAGAFAADPPRYTSSAA